MDKTILEIKAKEQLEEGKKKAAKLLEDEDKVEKFLRKAEKQLNSLPIAGGRLGNLPIFISMIRSYIKKQYKDVPMGSLLAMVSAVLYFLFPFDIIPDFIPQAGRVDDAIVLGICWGLVSADVNAYVEWREKKGL